MIVFRFNEIECFISRECVQNEIDMGENLVCQR